MGNRIRAVFAALIGFAAMAAHGQACTVNVTPATAPNLTLIIEGAANNAVICLGAGTYNSSNVGSFYNDATSFAIAKPVTIRGADGTTPAQVILQATAGGDHAVKFFTYGGFAGPSGATLKGLTITGAQGGIQVYNFQNTAVRLTDITIKDVVIGTTTNGGGFGVLIRDSDRIVMDTLTVTSSQTAFNLLNATDSLLANSTVVRSFNAAGLSVIGGANNVIAGNTIGTPKAVLGTYSFPTGGVTFYNTNGNRFDNNVVQGMQFDGVDWTALDGAPFQLPAGQATQNSNDNYAGKNHVISTGFADGLPGGSGMWSNCSSQNTWLYGNDVEGSVECGICVWLSRRNMLQANKLHNHGISGIFESGGAETFGDCYSPTYQQRPTTNFLQSNSLYFNRNDQLIIRNTTGTLIARNYMASSNGFGGPLQQCLGPDTCQSAITVETDASLANSGGHRIVANTSHDNKRGLWTENDPKTTGLNLSLNRILNERFSRYAVGPVTNIDDGAVVGGNFWTQHFASGNPSTGSTPYAGVIDTSGSNTIGKVVDRFPYETEDLGRGYGVTVFEPRANMSFAQGTRRTVRWNAPGCTMVDLLIDGATSLQSNVGNTGYAIVTIPLATNVGAHNIQVRCKDSIGNLRGSANSPTFNVTASTLQLLAPGRDDVFNAGQAIWVAFKKDPAVAVSIELSTDGGTTFPTILAAGVTNSATRVTLPAGASQARAVMRVRSSANVQDYTDGVFAIRGTGPGFTASNFSAGRVFAVGSMERLEWGSPANSRVVTITASINGGGPVNIVSDLPDRGSYDWMVPDLGVGTISLTLNFKQSNAVTAISSVASAGGNLRRASTVTFSPLQTHVVGGSQPISASSNSGLVVALSSLTPGVCTLSSGSVNAIGEGTCTIAGSVAGNGNYAASGQVTTSFLVSSQPPRLGNISTRMQVLTGNDVMIGGFVIVGNTNKTVVVRARGPSLIPFGITNALANPTLQLVRSSDQVTLAINDDWQTNANQAAITASGFAPGNNLESAILMSLSPGAYTAIVSGVGNGTGVGIVEVFEVDRPESPLANISTRGQVRTGNDVMIGGFVVQGIGPQTVVVRARGPSLIPFGITNALANPTLQLVRSSDGVTLAINDDWPGGPTAGAVSASGFAPSNSLESAVYITLDPGAYTVIVSGVGGGIGVGIVEVFTVQ